MNKNTLHSLVCSLASGERERGVEKREREEKREKRREREEKRERRS